MNPLPIDAHLPEIVDTLRDHQSLVLVAPPGAGKTTRVPPALLAAKLFPASHPTLIVLQPRRVAARSTASRIAEEQGWLLGDEVGYQVRFEKRITSKTRIRIQTEGILTRQLLSDPFLESVGAVILDEVHERSIHTDLVLALLREIRSEVRPDLRVIAMSATLDAEPVSRFLDDCPIIRVQGRSFPVSVRYRSADVRSVAESTASAIDDVLADTANPGHVLVFLPGKAEIGRVRGLIEARARAAGVVVLPLHGSLPPAEQDRALQPSLARKVILATNIAETSLTIDGVTTVIDGGLARIAHHDAERGFDRLRLERISQASAEQRAGRAGRTAPGHCIRLWSESQHRGLPENETPEVHRVDLCESLLSLHSWGLADPGSFTWYERPTAERLSGAEKLLIMLGAVDARTGTITPLGRRLHALPVHPRLGRLLIAADEAGRLEEGAEMAALLSEKDIVLRETASSGRGNGPTRHGGTSSSRGHSDVLIRLDLLRQAERESFSPRLRSLGIDPAAASQIARARDDLLRLCKRSRWAERHSLSSPVADDDSDVSILQWLLLAYPDRVVKRRGGEQTGLMVGGRGVRLAPESVVRESPFFLAIDPREDRRRGVLELQVRIASAIEREWLDTLHPELVRRERAVRFDEAKRRIVGASQLWFQDLLLHEDTSLTIRPEEGAEALAEAIAPRASQWFCEDPEVVSWLARLTFLKQAVPELDFPELDEAGLGELVRSACLSWGTTRLEDLERINRVDLLRSRLSRDQLRELEQGAPTSLTLPNGRPAKLIYEEGRPPVLAVRLQELFGWTETPRIARGRVSVLLQILGPNHRPVQITSDLGNFWKSTYHQVRKDLRGRYPKHAWPEDPWNTPPIIKPSKR